MFTTKLIEKIPDLTNAKEYCNSYLKRKNTKLVTWSKILTQLPKLLENPNTVDIKSVIIEHPKTSHNLSKAISLPERVPGVGYDKSSNSPLYGKTKTKWKLFKQKNCKNNKTIYVKIFFLLFSVFII